MSPIARLVQPVGIYREAITALVVGAAGFCLNMLELQLGWGMHFIFGNALVFAFLRTLRPGALIAASSIASAWTIVLWNHPWAWAIWTLEAAVLARLKLRSSPIQVDAAFWLILGAPLLLLTYGGVMHMDKLSVWLVIAKQAANGMLNVTLGEVIYTAALSFTALGRDLRLPRIPIGAFVTMVLTAVILIPTAVYLALDAPQRETDARSSVGRSLDDGLAVAGSGFALWQESHSFMLRDFADKQIAGRNASPVPPALRPEFTGVTAFDATGKRLWATEAATQPRIVPEALSPPGPRITELADGELAMIVPPRPGETGTTLVATVEADTLARMVIEPDRAEFDGLLLIGPSGRPVIVHSSSPEMTTRLEELPASIRERGRDRPALLSNKTYGNAIMSDLRDAFMVRTISVPGMPGWEAVGVAGLSGEVLKAREGQARLFMALLAFVAVVILVGSLLGRRIETSLRRLAQSAADLAIMGTRPDKIDSLVISELSDVSINIATAGSQVARERGALATYQRRLQSIAEHAPVIVYAVSLRDGRRARLTYVSEAIGTILGYTPEEAAARGWWADTIHPDDRNQYQAVFRDLFPGRIAHLEYRMRHRNGHYVWIYDNLAVEAARDKEQAEGVGLLMDVSERKFAAEQLIQADKMASLGRMVAGTAHELNQPLNFIKMAAANLRERTNRGLFSAEVFNTKLDAIIAHVNRASAIILQMRVFGRQPNELSRSVALIDVVESVLTMVRPQLEVDGIEIRFTEATADLAIPALLVLLEQVLLNLLLNAHDAIRARQQADSTRDGRIDITAARRAGLVVITVEDDGTGLHEETIPVMFEPFFTTKPPKEGTGLGLSISYGIIRDMGGAIRAENTRSGARFIIELPASR